MREKKHCLDTYFEKYYWLVMWNIGLFVKDYQAKEDICQETFIRLVGKLDDVPAKQVKSWLLRVSERLAKDYNKKGGKYRTDVGLELCEEFFFDVHADPGRIVIKKETCTEKKRVLERLKEEKPQWYEAIMMSSLEGMDNRAIGKELGVTSGLVSKWKERARKWLWDAYQKEYGDEG